MTENQIELLAIGLLKEVGSDYIHYSSIAPMKVGYSHKTQNLASYLRGTLRSPTCKELLVKFN